MNRVNRSSLSRSAHDSETLRHVTASRQNKALSAWSTRRSCAKQASPHERLIKGMHLTLRSAAAPSI